METPMVASALSWHGLCNMSSPDIWVNTFGKTSKEPVNYGICRLFSDYLFWKVGEGCGARPRLIAVNKERFFRIYLAVNICHLRWTLSLMLFSSNMLVTCDTWYARHVYVPRSSRVTFSILSPSGVTLYFGAETRTGRINHRISGN